MNTIKKNSTTILIVFATIILAGVAVFTAVRLYQLRQRSVSPTVPESEPKAWNCDSYNFSVDQKGVVSVSNSSDRSESPQKAQVIINGQLVATFDVPTINAGQTEIIGNVTVPESGVFEWQVAGTSDCRDSGKYESQVSSCELLTFTISTTTTPTPSPTATPTPTPTGTPTPAPTGTLTPTPTATPTPTPEATFTPTPTRTLAQATPTPTPTTVGAALPQAGIGLPTVVLTGFGLLLIFWAILLVV